MIAVLFAGCTEPEPSEPPPVATASVVDSPVPGQVGARLFAVRLPEPSLASVRCVSASPEEVHEQASSGVSSSHDFALFGLLADTVYDCVVTAHAVVVERTFTTDPLPAGLPTWTLTRQAEGGAGFTVFNHGLDTDQPDRNPKVLIVDAEGRLRWYHDVPYDASDLDIQYLGGGQLLYGGGYAVPPTIVDLFGFPQAIAPVSSTGQAYHHHAERLADGDVLTLARDTNSDGDVDWVGFTIERLDPTLSERTWVWTSQQAWEDGALPDPVGEEPGDVWHANSLQLLGDTLHVNLRQVSQLVALDPVTGDRRWTLGPGDDFALVDAGGQPAPYTDWFFGAHAPEREGDRILFYDNGVGRPGGGDSRAVELTIDEEARTAQVTWSFTEKGWSEPIWGDVDRLPNGNILILRGHCDHCKPHDVQQDYTQVVEVDPTTNTVVWRLTMTDPISGGYRAARIAACDIFDNVTLCAEEGPWSTSLPSP